MVRLEAQITHILAKVVLFQFHYGTIRRKWDVNIDKLIENFNSTMVRLEGLRLCTGLLKNLFQFHYGTIRSFTLRNKEEKLEISIPLWYD